MHRSFALQCTSSAPAKKPIEIILKYNHDTISDIKRVSGSLETIREIQLFRRDEPKPSDVFGTQKGKHNSRQPLIPISVTSDMSRDRSVSTITGCRLGNWVLIPGRGSSFFLITMSRLALGPTLLPVQWVPRGKVARA
jgi:hypothetical protein